MVSESLPSCSAVRDKLSESVFAQAMLMRGYSTGAGRRASFCSVRFGDTLFEIGSDRNSDSGYEMAKQPDVEVKNWPRYMPHTWRDRGILHHLVMVFDDGEEMVVSRWWSKKRGWQYDCQRFELVRMLISLQLGRDLR